MQKFLVFALLSWCLPMWGQSSYTRLHVPVKDMQLDNPEQVSYWGTATELPVGAVPFIAMNLEWRSSGPIPADVVRLWIRDDKSVDKWSVIQPDEHTGNGETRFFSTMHFLAPESRLFFIRVDVDRPWNEVFQDTLIVHLFDPGPTSPASSSSNEPAFIRGEECTCPPPVLSDRSQWCPDGTCLPHPAPEPVFPSHLIIHHSAGSNFSSDWAAVVRSIWNFHVNGNGWSDIGYNWLVDPNGVVYIGRGDNILGAHFCGKNTNTLGTCMMGDFTSVTPTANALASLADLYAWKACTEDIDPLGSSFHPASGGIIPNVSGHRQSCNTSCPGDAFFPLLPEVREQIAEVIQQCDCDFSVPEGLVGEVMASQVRLTWGAVAGATGYLLERKGPDDVDFNLLANVGNTVYLDLTVQPGQTYAYRVRANDGICISNPSGQVAVEVSDDWFLIQPTLVTHQVNVNIRNRSAFPVQMGIYSVDGRQVWAGEFGKSSIDFFHAIAMTDFPAGVYILVVQNGDIQKTVRLVKM